MYYVWIWDWKFTALHIPTWAVPIEDTLGRGGSQVVSVLAFYFDDPSSNPAEGNSFLLHLHFASSRSKCFQYFESFLFRNHSFEYVDGDSLYMTSQGLAGGKTPSVDVHLYIYPPKLVINMATRK